MLDIDALRAGTPGCDRVLHLNNAGAGLPPAAVLDAIASQLRREAEMGPMEAGVAAAQEIAAAYADLERLIVAEPGEVAIVGSQSQGFVTVFDRLDLRAGDLILVAGTEWGPSLAAFRILADRCGARVETIPDRPEGGFCPEALGRMLDDRVRLVSLTWAPATSGLLQDAVAVGRVLAGHSALFHVDAAQVLGQVPVDVRAIGCHVLTAPGRKWLRGPRGTGVLFVRRDALDRLPRPLPDIASTPWEDGGYRTVAGARRFETGERSPALVLGLGAAARLLLDTGVAAVSERIGQLATRLRDGLADLPGVRVTDAGPRLTGIVTCTVSGSDPVEMKRRLAARGINANAVPAHYTPIDMAARGLDAVLRLSPHVFTAEAEIDRAVAAVAEAARG